MQILMLFCLIPFLKTNAVLDHLPESIKVKKKTTTTTTTTKTYTHKKTQEKNRKKQCRMLGSLCQNKNNCCSKNWTLTFRKRFLLFASMIALQKS